MFSFILRAQVLPVRKQYLSQNWAAVTIFLFLQSCQRLCKGTPTKKCYNCLELRHITHAFVFIRRLTIHIFPSTTVAQLDLFFFVIFWFALLFALLFFSLDIRPFPILLDSILYWHIFHHTAFISAAVTSFQPSQHASKFESVLSGNECYVLLIYINRSLLDLSKFNTINYKLNRHISGTKWRPLSQSDGASLRYLSLDCVL